MSMELVAILPLIAVTIFFTVMAFQKEEHDVFKIFFSILAFLALLITLNTSNVIAVSSNYISNVTTLTSTSFIFTVMLFAVIIVYLLVIVVKDVAISYKERKRKIEEGEIEE